jgi:hypothetical protein
MSHYEIEQPLDSRLSDAEWKSKITGGSTPPPPEWTKDYLLP